MENSDRESKGHRVTSALPADLDGKRLRWYEDEESSDYYLKVEDPDPRDSSFVLWAGYCSLPQQTSGEGERENLPWPGRFSLDQSTVDRIECVDTVTSPYGFDFVVFDRSTSAQEEFHRGG